MIIKKKRILVYLLSTLMTITTCLFLCQGKTAKAKEYENSSSAGYTVENVVHISFDYEDIPSEITDPIEKGKHLFCYVIISLGAISALCGGVQLGIAWLGHQPDMQAKGFIFLFVGIFIILLPIVINWMVPKANLL